MDLPHFPPFCLSRLLRNTFRPKPGERICILIDLPDLGLAKDWAFLGDEKFSIQRHAHDSFYRVLHDSVMAELDLSGGEFFAYDETGGSNLDLPDRAVAPDGTERSLERDVYPNFDIILCISTHSATAPLTALAKRHGFRGATLHGVNDTILRSDHLGGDLTPDKFAKAQNATHDDILFSPSKTPDITVSEVRMQRDGGSIVVLESYQPAEHLLRAIG